MLTLFRSRIVERSAAFALRAWGFTSRWITTRQGLVHVLECPGHGPPLVLMHGLVASGADYFPVLRRLASAGHAVIAPDLPGHGLSPVPPSGMHHGVLLSALLEALDQVLTRPAVVFGNSLGGFAAIRLATVRPHLVSGLFLASPGGAPLPESSLQDFLERFRIDDPIAARRFVEDMQGRPSWLPSLVAWGVQERFSRPEIRELLASIEPSLMLTPDEVGALQPPTVVMWGRQERILPPVQREFFRRHLPEHASFEEPPGLGHAPFLDDPDFVAQRFLRFANRVCETPQG